MVGDEIKIRYVYDLRLFVYLSVCCYCFCDLLQGSLVMRKCSWGNNRFYLWIENTFLRVLLNEIFTMWKKSFGLNWTVLSMKWNKMIDIYRVVWIESGWFWKKKNWLVKIFKTKPSRKKIIINGRREFRALQV